jgi:hypothetical protein
LGFVSPTFLRGSLLCALQQQLQGFQPSRLVFLSSIGLNGVRVVDLPSG